jgi:hypothetical protein
MMYQGPGLQILVDVPRYLFVDLGLFLETMPEQIKFISIWIFWIQRLSI